MIRFTCTICEGRIVFDDDDDVIENTCMCEDNPVRDETPGERSEP